MAFNEAQYKCEIPTGAQHRGGPPNHPQRPKTAPTTAFHFSRFVGVCHKTMRDKMTMQPMHHNNNDERGSKVIIFDWDDTICPSSFFDREQIERANELPVRVRLLLYVVTRHPTSENRTKAVSRLIDRRRTLTISTTLTF
jgi:hypothetical protein